MLLGMNYKQRVRILLLLCYFVSLAYLTDFTSKSLSDSTKLQTNTQLSQPDFFSENLSKELSKKALAQSESSSQSQGAFSYFDQRRRVDMIINGLMTTGKIIKTKNRVNKVLTTISKVQDIIKEKAHKDIPKKNLEAIKSLRAKSEKLKKLCYKVVTKIMDSYNTFEVVLKEFPKKIQDNLVGYFKTQAQINLNKYDLGRKVYDLIGKILRYEKRTNLIMDSQEKQKYANKVLKEISALTKGTKNGDAFVQTFSKAYRTSEDIEKLEANAYKDIKAMNMKPT